MNIKSGITMLETSAQSHVFLIQGKENILIDTGFPGQGDKILQELNTMGIDPKSIRHILLTHHDVDHIGNAQQLAEATGAEIWAPAEDIPYITGEKKRPGMKRVINNIMKAKVPDALHPLVPGQQFNGLTVIAAPGHTPGHMIFYYDKVIFAGDLMRISNGNPSVSPRIMNWDHRQAAQSISTLKPLEIDWICPAHGQPARMNDAIRSFIADAV